MASSPRIFCLEIPRRATALRSLNRELIAALGLVRGVSHAEFIRSRSDGHFYFLECAARVGGAYISEMVEVATGINLWREWARIEIAGGKEPYRLPAVRGDYAGLILSLARQEDPDTSAYNDPEIALAPQAASSCRAGAALIRPGANSIPAGELHPPFRRRISGHRTARNEAGGVNFTCPRLIRRHRQTDFACGRVAIGAVAAQCQQVRAIRFSRVEASEFFAFFAEFFATFAV